MLNIWWNLLNACLNFRFSKNISGIQQLLNKFQQLFSRLFIAFCLKFSSVCSANVCSTTFVQQILFHQLCSANFVQQIMFSKFCSANFAQQIWAIIRQYSTICHQLIKLNSASVNQNSQLTNSANSANFASFSNLFSNLSATC